MGCSQSGEPKKEPTGKLRVGENRVQTLDCKAVFLGDAGVGKSSIGQRFVNNKFSTNYEVTIGGAYMEQRIQLDSGNFLKFHLWDTGGEERFRAMTPLYYRDASAAILVYDITEQASFQSLNYWLKELDEKVKKDNMVLVLAGNKCDMTEKRQVAKEAAEKLAGDYDMIFFEVSAKGGDGVQEMFKAMAERIARQNPQ
mmetsp:Transcript_36995/g.43214  ORF Transcript_36995/g.43214 Transcript_36995/m.43214 type:complete len:198 (+) Transcript_36995:32-625(+)